MTSVAELDVPTYREEDCLWQVQACRGKEGLCRFALASLSRIKECTDAVLQASAWDTFVRRNWPGRLLSHHRLEIALAACPNACTRPQIQAIGVIAALRPEHIQEKCTGCRQCGLKCRENAMRVDGTIAQPQTDKCLACGECVAACPIDAIETEQLYFRIMIGGRMGRHPRWASELPGKLSSDQVPMVIARFVELMIDETHPFERISACVERLGSDQIWKAIEQDYHE